MESVPAAERIPKSAPKPDRKSTFEKDSRTTKYVVDDDFFERAIFIHRHNDMGFRIKEMTTPSCSEEWHSIFTGTLLKSE